MGVCAVLEAQKIPAHCARIADQSMGPHQDALAFRRKTLKAGCALHQRSVEHLLETLDAKRQGRLGNATTFGSAAKMLLTRQGNHEFQFLKHGRTLTLIELAYEEHLVPTTVV